MLRHAALAALLSLSACGRLGNPPLETRSVGAPVVSPSGLVLVTRVTNVPSSRRDALPQRIAPYRPDAIDAHIEDKPFVAIVEVTATNAPYVRGELKTQLALADGSLLERRWTSSTRRIGGIALFGVDMPVRTATTTME